MPVKTTSDAGSISPWRVFVAVLAAPAAWTLQVAIAEALAAQSCFPYDAPMRASYAGDALRALIGVSAAALLVGIAGTYLSWRYWRRLASRSPDGQGGPRGSPANGETFVARVGFLSSVVFLFALIATDIATALISSCR